MSYDTDTACKRRSWLLAGAGGVFLAILLVGLAHFALLEALFFGLMFFGLFGGFVVWAFCTGKGHDVPMTERMSDRDFTPAKFVPKPQPARVEPVAAPAAPVAPAPVAVAPVAAPEVKASPAPASAPAALMDAAVRRVDGSAPVEEIKPAPKKAPAKAKAHAKAKAEKVAEAAPAKVSKSKVAASAHVAEKPAAKAKAVAAPEAAKPVRKAKAAAAEPVAAAPAKAKAAAETKAEAAPVKAKATRTPRAAGLDAAMGKTKDAPAPAATPLLLKAPRGGKGDDLKLIIGIGPALEKLLNSVGVWHFDQMASWKAKDIAFVDGKMEGFHGRITRDEWVKQAKILAKGGTVEDVERAIKGAGN